MHPNLRFIAHEFSLLFEEFNLELLELLDKLKGIFSVDIPIEEDFVTDNLDALFSLSLLFRRRHS